MEKRFFLDWVQLEGTDVPPGNAQRSSPIESYPADSVPPLADHAPMAAGKALQFPASEIPVELPFPGVLPEEFFQRRFLWFDHEAQPLCLLII